MKKKHNQKKEFWAKEKGKEGRGTSMVFDGEEKGGTREILHDRPLQKGKKRRGARGRSHRTYS